MTENISPPTPPTRKEWFKSSYTNASGSCVEVNLTAESVLVRDSKDRRVDRPVLGVSADGWKSFLRTVVR
ncbi:DUF397 domain-containing protein [Amycolatopsis samaneae]|uniref:DUF397 domain-containing protein n=1 Tax=Amycolatopsis samaneae TaxID=664691 RepID=A0ABW5GMH0_9PSEU